MCDGGGGGGGGELFMSVQAVVFLSQEPDSVRNSNVMAVGTFDETPSRCLI